MHFMDLSDSESDLLTQLLLFGGYEGTVHSFPLLDQETVAKCSSSLCKLLCLAENDKLPSHKALHQNLLMLLNDFVARPVGVSQTPVAHSELLSALLPLIDLQSTSNIGNWKVVLGYIIINGVMDQDNFQLHILNQIIKDLLNDLQTEDICQFMNHIWLKKEKFDLPVDVLEEIILKMPQYLERTLVNLVQSIHQVSSKEVNVTIQLALNTPQFQYLVQSSSVSAITFQATTSILNQLVQIKFNNANVLILVQTFVKHISDLCSSENMIKLFPSDCQVLAKYLQIPPEAFAEGHVPNDLLQIAEINHQENTSNSTKILFGDRSEFVEKNILRELALGLRKCRSAIVALLTYYPRWYPYLLQYCIAQGIGRVISPELSRVDKQAL